MKQISSEALMVSGSNAKRWAAVFSRQLAAVLIGTSCMAIPAWADLPPAQYYGGVEYVTGGFGVDESTAMKAAMPDYSLVFTFAASDGNRSAYVSRVQVVVRDHYDATVLNVETQGPFLLARIGPGSYQVHATYRNQTQSRQVNVAEGKSTRLVFEWKRDTVDPRIQEPAMQNDAMQPDGRFEFAPGSIPGLD